MCHYVKSNFDHYLLLEDDDKECNNKYYSISQQPFKINNNDTFANVPKSNIYNYNCGSQIKIPTVEEEKGVQNLHVPYVNIDEEKKTGPQNNIKLKWSMKSKLNFVLERFFYVNYFWQKFTTEFIHKNNQTIESILQTVIYSVAYNLFKDGGEHFINNVMVYNWPNLYETTQEFMIAQITDDNEPELPQACCPSRSSSIPTCINNESFEKKRKEQSLTIIVDMQALQHFMWYMSNFNPGFERVNVEFEPHLQSSGFNTNKTKLNTENVIIGQVEQSLKLLKNKLCQVSSPYTSSSLNTSNKLDKHVNTIDNKYISSKEDQLPLGLLLSVLFYDKIITFIHEKFLLHTKYNIKLQQIDSVKFTLRDVLGYINIYKLKSNKNIDHNKDDDDDDDEEPKNKILKPGNFKIQTI
jgi:hypothetical protein